MPRTAATHTDLSPEELQKISQEEWRGIEARARKQVKRVLRLGNAPSREIAETMRAAAIAKEQAYPDASTSGLSVNLPAKLLKPIEMAITAVRKMPLKTQDNPESVD